MNIMKKVKSFYRRLNINFEKQFGWFFTNGRKSDAEPDWVMN